MTKLSDLKAGDRFTVEATVIDCDMAALTFKLSGALSANYMPSAHSFYVEVTKIPDPPRDLVKGERIISKTSFALLGEYIGRGYVWWDGEPRPDPLVCSPTTKYYDVLDVSADESR